MAGFLTENRFELPLDFSLLLKTRHIKATRLSKNVLPKALAEIVLEVKERRKKEAV